MWSQGFRKPAGAHGESPARNCRFFKLSWQSMTFFLFKPTARILAAAAIAVTSAGFADAAPVLAAQPAEHLAQVPGYYRMALGDLKVTALYDGYVMLDRSLLKGASDTDLQNLLAKVFLADTKEVQTAVNAYLVQTGKNLVLVDAGAAKCFGPTLGGIGDNLRAAGYGDMARIDSILLTHLHPDHVCGLTTADGKAAFPNATVYVTKAEADFWLNEDTAAKAPKEHQPFFEMAREAVAPYVASGKLKIFNPGDRLMAGVTAVPTPGHTPGHAGYLFESGKERLLVWGDVVHSHAVQFARPEIAIEFDVDSTQAIASRQKTFADAANKKLWIAGAHMPFPGIGRVRKEGNTYAWVPVEYAPLPTGR
jgi:glyoxylase-like metal-dependent hydrolase (beta-lactamase superfamily II)